MIISHEEEQVTKVEVVDKVVCNCCGKPIKVDKTFDIINEYIHITKNFGYFSKHDGEIHSMDICESCYENFIATFRVKPHIENPSLDWID